MGSLQEYAPLVLMFLVVYLFMIRPQLKRSKQEKKFANELKKGDKIITKSGMHGKIFDLYQDGTCVIETSAGKIKFERSSISTEMSAKLNAPKEIKGKK